MRNAHPVELDHRLAGKISHAYVSGCDDRMSLRLAIGAKALFEHAVEVTYEGMVMILSVVSALTGGKVPDRPNHWSAAGSPSHAGTHGWRFTLVTDGATTSDSIDYSAWFKAETLRAASSIRFFREEDGPVEIRICLYSPRGGVLRSPRGGVLRPGVGMGGSGWIRLGSIRAAELFIGLMNALHSGEDRFEPADEGDAWTLQSAARATTTSPTDTVTD